ncbi:hypothetical protein Vi05172_g9982 [Venturia inaequalis]|nr:hypothetical protein Vi05172_g9982 [Venturia inaequalis]
MTTQEPALFAKSSMSQDRSSDGRARSLLESAPLKRKAQFFNSADQGLVD